MKSGRKPKPTHTLKMTGAYRKDRHAGRGDALPHVSQPVKPEDFGETESQLWDQVVPDLIRRGLVGELDTAELRSMCELWGLYRASYAMAKLAPADKEIRCAVTGYWGAFNRVASKFGLSPPDLAALKAPAPDAKKGIATRARA